MTVGVDLVHVPGFAQQLEDRASGFVDHTFTPRERRTRAPHRLAARFAAKEAFIKAWSGSRTHQPPLLGSTVGNALGNANTVAGFYDTLGMFGFVNVTFRF